MNLPLRAWTLSADALPDRLLDARGADDAFTLPGAEELSAFADLLGAQEDEPPQPAQQSAPFDLPALLPEDVSGEASLSREIDFSALCGDRAVLRLSMVSGSGEALLSNPAWPDAPPRRLCRFGDGPLSIDLSDALRSQKRLRVTLRFDGRRPAGICGPVMLCVITDAMLGDVVLRPLPARLLSLDATVTVLRAGTYQLIAQPCPSTAPDAQHMPPARAVSLRLCAGETRQVQLSMSVPGEAFVPGRPYAAPSVKLTLRREDTVAPCDSRALMYGYGGAPARSWLPLTPGECLLPPQMLLDRLADLHVTSVLMPVSAPDALYAALTRAGIAVRQIADESARARIARFPCVTFAEAERTQSPDPALCAWQLCGMTAYLRAPDPGMTPAELLAEAAGRPVDDHPRRQEVLAWLRAVCVRLRAEAIRQGRAGGPLCAPGEGQQDDIRDALRTALAPTHLSALPLYGAWWTGTRFSATVQAFVSGDEMRPLRAEVTLEDMQGGTLAHLEADCPAGGGVLGVIEAQLPDVPCTLELTCRLLAGETAVETHALPVYVGERGPLEAAFE